MQDQPIPRPQQVQVDLAVIASTTKLVAVVGGKYLGSLTFDAPNTDALGVLAQIFAQYVAQAQSGIQVSNGAGIPGLRTP